MATKNLETLRKLSEAMAKNDVETMFALFADDVIVHIGGRSKLAGDLKGKQELMQNFEQFAEVVGEDAGFETHATLADDEHGIVLQQLKSKKPGAPTEIPGVGIFHFNGDTISEAWFFDIDPYTADAFYDSAS